MSAASLWFGAAPLAIAIVSARPSAAQGADSVAFSGDVRQPYAVGPADQRTGPRHVKGLVRVDVRILRD